jgi:hypothetical protein
MARHYQIDIAVFAAESDRKWVDNLLSHFDVPGVEAAKQGVARQLTQSGVYHVALTRRLWLDGGMSVEAALAAARRLLSDPSGRLLLAPSLELRLDREEFRARIDERISEAVESIVPRRRGRPPAR